MLAPNGVAIIGFLAGGERQTDHAWKENIDFVMTALLGIVGIELARAPGESVRPTAPSWFSMDT